MLEGVLTISILAASLLTFPKLPQVQKFCLFHHQPNILPLMPPSWERNPPRTPPQVPLLVGALGRLCPLLSFGQSRDQALGAWEASKPKEERGGIASLWPQQHPSPASNRWGAQALWGAGQLSGCAAAPQPKAELNWRFEAFYLKQTPQVPLLKTNLNLFLEAIKSSVDIIFHFHHCFCGGWFQPKAEILVTYINTYIHLNTLSSREFQESSEQVSE